MNSTWYLFGLAALLCSCVSTPSYQGTAQNLGEDLLSTQLV